MVCAFIDESWVPASPTGEYFVVVASVVTTNRRNLELLARRVRKVPELKATSELKASLTHPRLVKRFLRGLADDPDVSVVASLWRGDRQKVQDEDALYQGVVAECALATVRQHPRIDLHLDKRYTHQRKQRELEGAIREALAAVPGNVVRVFQEDSHKVKELSAPDFVAWAFTQRYCRSDPSFYSLVRPKMAHFSDLNKRKATLPRDR